MSERGTSTPTNPIVAAPAAGQATRQRFRLPLDVVRRGTIPHVAALDGMRGVAVLLVMVYHLGATSVPGGFLGVEMFFVVSGYLITSLLVAELRDNGYLDLAGFWSRRIRRLVPALLLLLGILAVTVPFIASDASAALRGDIPAALLYLANWWQIVAEQSYFESFGRPALLQHLWSLAIEEQFYVVWPPVLAVLYTRLRRRWIIPVLTGGGALLSVLLMAVLFEPGLDPSRVYYGTDTRASALLIGTTLAFIWNPDVPRRRINPPPLLIDVTALVGIIVLVTGVTRWNGFDPTVYQGGFLLVSLGTSLVIIAASTPYTIVGAALRAPALRWLGERSYGLYLWHWPIIQLTRPGADVPIDGITLLAVRVLLIAGAAEASWQLVERPLRRPRLSSRGAASLRYRRASVVVAVATPLLVFPFVVSSSTAGGADRDLFVDQPVAIGPDTAAPVDWASIVAPETFAPPVTGPPQEEPAPPTTVAPQAPIDGGDVLFVGDSVTLGAKDELLRRLPGSSVDAVVGRQFRDAIDLLRELREANAIRPIVVLHLGSNGSATPTQLQTLVDILEPAERIVFLTTTAPREWRDTVNRRLGELAEANDRVRLIDWRELVRSETGLLTDDGVHLRPSGALRYAAFVEAALR